MELQNARIGIAMTGSFCTFERTFEALRQLTAAGADLYPILSDSCQTIESRFGSPDLYLQTIREITGKEPMKKIAEAEAIGPTGFLDVCIILPCTGNTAAKLANGITDSPVLMAAKAHLRNAKPLVLFLSTNDGLAMNMKNIGLLCNTKNIFLVPFGQDNPQKKPNSLMSHWDCILPTLSLALSGKQYQPMLISYPEVQ